MPIPEYEPSETPTNLQKKGFIVNEKGGIKHNEGKLMCRLIDPLVIVELAKVLTYGADKYSPENWKKVDREEYISAMWRHWLNYLSGEEKDQESGLDHLSHMLCNIQFLMWFDREKKNNGFKIIP